MVLVAMLSADALLFAALPAKRSGLALMLVAPWVASPPTVMLLGAGALPL